MIDLEEFDPTDSNAGAKAAEYANRLEGILLEIIACLGAKEELDRGFKGMGYNILQLKVGMIKYYIRQANKLIAEGLK